MSVWTCGRWVALGALLALSAPICVQDAAAAGSNRRSDVNVSVRTAKGHAAAVRGNAGALQRGVASYSRNRGLSVARYGQVGGGLQCVPFARENSGIELSGNAHTWWSGAEGIYERGGRPEVGSVLNFRANGRMRMGHVAVVSRVINGRTIEIDHANWSGPGLGRGRVSRNIDVVDVSPQNDWTAVRVALGQGETFGSVYPTYGFIYDRPDRGTMLANASTSPVLALNPPPRDLRPMSERVLVSLGADQDEEVAEAADDTQPRMRSRSHSRTRVAAKHGKSTPALVRTVGARSQPAKATSQVRRARHGT